MAFVASIVEGHGEIEAIPILLRRLNNHIGAPEYLQMNAPIRIKSGSFLNDDDYFNKYVALAAAKAAEKKGCVLIILDCEDYCPATLGPSLLSKAQAVRNDVRYLVVLAYREFESWFIAAAESLRGHFGFPDDFSAPADIEGIRDAKGWLGKRMNIKYDPITHQHQLTKIFDLDQAQNTASFKRFCDYIPYLLGYEQGMDTDADGDIPPPVD